MKHSVRVALDAMYGGLIAGDGRELIKRTRWQKSTEEATLGVRWGLGVHVAGLGAGLGIDSEQELEQQTGSIGPALVSRIQTRIDRGDFGDWSGEDRLLTAMPVFGGGNLSEVREASRRLGLDAMVMISVRQSTNSTLVVSPV